MYINGQDRVVKMSVYNTKGELIYIKDQKILDIRKADLDLSGLPSGTYLINLESPTVRKTFKIIKN